MKELLMRAKTRIAVKTTGDPNKTLSKRKKWKIQIGILKTPITTSTTELNLVKKELTSLIKRKNKGLRRHLNEFKCSILYTDLILSMRFRIN